MIIKSLPNDFGDHNKSIYYSNYTYNNIKIYNAKNKIQN